LTPGEDRQDRRKDQSKTVPKSAGIKILAGKRWPMSFGEKLEKVTKKKEEHLKQKIKNRKERKN
jgi:hypothetical protein